MFQIAALVAYPGIISCIAAMAYEIEVIDCIQKLTFHMF